MLYLIIGFLCYFLGRFEDKILLLFKIKKQVNNTSNLTDLVNNIDLNDFFDNSINDKRDFISDKELEKEQKKEENTQNILYFEED